MQNLASALAEFHKAVGPILKQSTAQYGKYADLATVLSVVTPHLSTQGLVLTQTFMPFEASTILRTTLLHSSGETLTSDLPMLPMEGRGNPLHAFGGAVTYLRRYAVLALLNLAAEDDDGDSWDEAPKAVAKVGTGTQSKSTHKRSPAPAPAALKPEEIKQLLSRLQSDLDSARLQELIVAYRHYKKLDPDARIGEQIKTPADVEFINTWLLSNAQQPVAP